MVLVTLEPKDVSPKNLTFGAHGISSRCGARKPKGLETYSTILGLGYQNHTLRAQVPKDRASTHGKKCVSQYRNLTYHTYVYTYIWLV